MNDLDGSGVLAALREEAAACGELAGLRAEQRRLIESGEAEALLEVLARKEKALARIARAEERIRPLRAQWETRKAALAASQRVAIGDAFVEVRQLLEKLIAAETEDAEALAAKKKATEGRIETFDRRRQLHMVYGRAAPGLVEGRMVDRRDV
jgi:hypothetical protein